MKKNKVILIILAVLILLFTAFVVNGYLSGENSKPMDELTVADANFETNSLYFIALDKGYFKDENLIVNRKIFAIGKDAMDDVVQGNSDIAAVPDIVFLTQFKNGEDIKVISALQKSERSTSILGWRSHGVNSLADLPGKKIGIVKGTNSEFLFLSLMANNNIPTDKVNIYYGGLNEIDELFRLGKIDAISIGNPNAYQIVSDVGEKNVSQFYADANIDATVLAAETLTIKDKRTAMIKFLRALNKAEAFEKNLANHADSVAIVTKVMNTDSATTVDAIWDNYKFGLGLDNLLMEILNSHSQELTALEAIPNGPDKLLDGVFTDYLKEINPEDVTIFK